MTERGQSAAPRYAPELMIWFSPSFPTGAFAYSQGLETAAAEGWIATGEDLESWLRNGFLHGALSTELALLSLAIRASDESALPGINDLACAFQPSRERYRESMALGAGFRAAVTAGWPDLNTAFATFETAPLSYPVAVGVAARAKHLDRRATLDAFANASASHLLSAAIRLSLVGQFGAQAIHANLLPTIAEAVERADRADEADIGTATFAADIATMKHETDTTRLFQS